MSKNLEAWDGVFTAGQLQDIIQMALKAERRGFKLSEEIKNSPPVARETTPDIENKIKTFSVPVKKPCPECKGLMTLYPVNTDPRGFDKIGSTDFEDTEGTQFKSMWLCGKSCNNTGCLHEEFNFYSVEEYRKTQGA